MDNDLLKDTINGTMNVYKVAYEEGKKSGYHQGFIDGLNKAKEISEKVFGKDKKDV